jgi:hypothetical protein
VLDLVQPQCTRGRRWGFGRETGSDESGRQCTHTARSREVNSEGPGRRGILDRGLSVPGESRGVGGNAAQHYKRGDVPFQLKQKGRRRPDLCAPTSLPQVSSLQFSRLPVSIKANAVGPPENDVILSSDRRHAEAVPRRRHARMSAPAVAFKRRSLRTPLAEDIINRLVDYQLYG